MRGMAGFGSYGYLASSSVLSTRCQEDTTPHIQLGRHQTRVFGLETNTQSSERMREALASHPACLIRYPEGPVRPSLMWLNGPQTSHGLVGLLGISYYAGSQWRVVAHQPRGLACIIPWEGMSNYYRDRCKHGGILSNTFLSFWWNRQVH